MRTRCPVCNTVFRVTSEQLRIKAGKVRCGHCQSLFNAFDSLVDDTVDLAPPPVGESAAPASPPLREPAPPTSVLPTTEVVPPEAIAPTAPAIVEDQLPAPETAPKAADQPEAPLPEAERPAEAVSPAAAPPADSDADATADAEPVADEAPVADRAETVEQSTLAAREAGLVAARELSDTPAYNRWAAGTLSGDSGGFASEAAAPARWPFTLAAVALLLALAVQLAHHFRSDLVLHLPQTAALFAAAAVDVPLPRKVELVSIESSDLQSDNARGLLVLQATLRNRAAFAQAWPDLELTLTDTKDGVVSRRILAATDYLPPGTNPQAFAANGEIAIRLWVEAKDLGAAGYRLYLFYP